MNVSFPHSEMLNVRFPHFLLSAFHQHLFPNGSLPPLNPDFTATKLTL
jgi:hypothetical protein